MIDTTIVAESAALAFDMQAAGHTPERIIAAAKSARDNRLASTARYRSALLALGNTAHGAGTSHRSFAKAGMPAVLAALAARDRFLVTHKIGIRK